MDAEESVRRGADSILKATIVFGILVLLVVLSIPEAGAASVSPGSSFSPSRNSGVGSVTQQGLSLPARGVPPPANRLAANSSGP